MSSTDSDEPSDQLQIHRKRTFRPRPDFTDARDYDIKLVNFRPLAKCGIFWTTGSHNFRNNDFWNALTESYRMSHHTPENEAQRMRQWTQLCRFMGGFGERGGVLASLWSGSVEKWEILSARSEETDESHPAL
ncbi:hypothetical protein Ddc_03931 [Ditylenchus destructor]|nr:hypothetical protein Ddc_03931 [Ditylenchus destructor]